DDVGIGLHAEPLGRAPEERLVVPVAARVEADVPADGAHVAKLRSAHELRGLGEGRKLVTNTRVARDGREGRAGADVEVAVLLYAGGVAHAAERDEQPGRELSPFHVRAEIGTARDEHHAQGRRAIAPIDRARTVPGA